VVLAGTIAGIRSSAGCRQGTRSWLRLSFGKPGASSLPVAAWHKDVGKRALKGISKGDDVLVYGQLARRFYRSGAGARSLTEVIASGIKKLEVVESD
jgi:single-stranded DNA-binding protein